MKDSLKINHLDLELASELVLAGPATIRDFLLSGKNLNFISPHLRDHLVFRKDDVAFWVSLQDEYLSKEDYKGGSLTFKELCEMFFDSMKSGTSLSLTRWGDGEGMALPVLLANSIGWVIPNNYALPDSHNYQHPLRRIGDWAWREIWFGKNFSEESFENRTLLAASIQNAIANSSIVAYYRPEPFKTITRGSPFRRSLGVSMLRPMIENIRPSTSHPINPRLHIQLHREGVLARLLAESKNVLVITSKEKVAQTIFEIYGVKVDLILIPSEQGRQLRVEGTGAKKSEVNLLDTWIQTTQTIKESGNGWDLVLVGGGLVGKAIVGELSSIPGVVLDIGSIMDDLAGFKNRSWMR